MLYELLITSILTVLNLKDAYDLLRDTYRSWRGRLKKTKTTKGVTVPLGTWPERFWAALLALLKTASVADFFIGLISKGFGLGFLGFALKFPDKAKDAIGLAANFIVSFEPLAAELAGHTMTQIIGVPVEAKKPLPGATAKQRRAEVIDLGSQFANVLSAMFNIEEAQQDFTTRTGYNGSVNNMLSYFGTNLTFQLRSLTIGTIASLTGWHTLRHLENLHQSVNWAFGFGWLSWSVMSAIMDVAVNPGLKRYYLSRIKPHDFSEAQGINAHVRGLFPRTQLDELLDGQGLRIDIRDTLITMAQSHYTASQAASAYVEGRINDATLTEAFNRHALVPGIRPTLVDMAEQNLTPADLKCLWQQGQLSEAQMIQHLRWHGYREERAKLKAYVLMHECKAEKADKEVEALRHLFRDCVITEPEFRLEMQTRTKPADEQDHQVRLGLIERRYRTYLPIGDMVTGIVQGSLDMNDAYEQLRCRGYTGPDALLHLITHLQKLLPKCVETSLSETDAIAALQILGATLGTGGGAGTVQLLNFIQCLSGLRTLAAPIIRSFKATPPVVAFKDITELSWDVIGADKVTITHIGEVPAQGRTEYLLTEPIGFVLTAENPVGKTTDYVYVRIHTEPVTTIPTILTSFTPTSGPTTGGTVVVLTGSGFTGATGVNFGYAAGTGFQVDSDTQITVTSPPGTGRVDVRVAGASGFSPTGQTLMWTYGVSANVPVLTSLTPNTGPTVGGTTVVLTGTGFTGATAVHFGYGVGTGFQVDSDTQITVDSPPGYGTVDVKVITPAGESATGQAQVFHYA